MQDDRRQRVAFGKQALRIANLTSNQFRAPYAVFWTLLTGILDGTGDRCRLNIWSGADHPDSRNRRGSGRCIRQYYRSHSIAARNAGRSSAIGAAWSRRSAVPWQRADHNPLASSRWLCFRRKH